MSKNFVSNEDANVLFEKVGNRLGLRPKTFTGTHDQWDQLTEPQQSEYEYVNFTDDYAAGSMIFKRTLAAGATTVTVEDPSITSEVMIDVYADVFGVAPTNESVSNGVLTLTFPAQQSAVNLKIVVSGNPDKGGHGGGGVGGWSPHCIIHSDTGSTVTVVKGSTTVTAEETSTGIFECDLPDNDYGEWTFNGVVDGSAMHLTTDIKVVQRYEINFINGKTALPVNDATLLLECAGIYDSSAETISDILADTELLTAVVASNNAMDYMARSTDWINDVCTNETAMSMIGLNNYASRALLASEAWTDIICDSAYVESILNAKSPIMTSDNTPVGYTITYSGQNSGENRYARYAFDGKISGETSGTFWEASGGRPAWIQMEFPEPIIFKMCKYTPSYGSEGHHSSIKNYAILKSADGSIFDTLFSGVSPDTPNSTPTYTKKFLSNMDEGKYCRFQISDTYYAGLAIRVAELVFYGRRDV